MTSLGDQLLYMELHNSVFESSVRKLPLPTCVAFGMMDKPQAVSFTTGKQQLGTKDSERVAKAFPQSVGASGNNVLSPSGHNPNSAQKKRVAVLFSGGPASGGHNVICGIKHILGDDNTLLGVRAGPKGLLKGSLTEITTADVDAIINTGGFDLLGTDRTKIQSKEQFATVKAVCIKNKIDAIVIIGGDDSNTNAAALAEYLFRDVKPDGSGVQVIGVPKTIDGDLQIGELLPISFGFDTATKIYGEMVGNILEDARSSLKYWHFIKLMGRSASHVTLEVALQTKPAFTVISEEVAKKKLSLNAIVEQICGTVVARSKKGLNHGVVLIPEGVIEFIPEVRAMIDELNEAIRDNAEEFSSLHTFAKSMFIRSKLSDANARLLSSLPDEIISVLMADRDAHDNLQVSLIPTEHLLADMVEARLKEIDPKFPFNSHYHFLGYEGRCGAPTHFDAAYAYNLGLTAGSLILDGRTGYMATVTGLDKGGIPRALPLTGLIDIERRHGKDEFVIEKALVKIDSPAMKFFLSRRDDWAADDLFTSPGPRQIWGPAANQQPISVALNQKSESLAFRIGPDQI